ncbi:MAG: sugar phosphate isomerase/epimerase [Alphaproteobacteria bacterium]|nr:sugar phosphate isomerase/epimerase [Alphaproteobacteria bacterium]
MNALGVHALVFVSGWSQGEAARAIDHARACGYPYLEIPLIDPKAIDVKQTRNLLESAGVTPITSLGLGMDTDISSDDPPAVSRGEALLNDALSVARDLGSSMLSGVLYSALSKYRKPPSEAGRWNCLQALRRLAEKAKAADMTIGIEPVNRYESNLINTGDDALKLIDAIGADNMVVHLDSYHMNIEEGAPGPLIERLGKRLGYVHINESHRGYLGTGSIDFDVLFQALADHDYDGVITFEAFSAGIGDPELNAELAVWRPLWNDPDDLARHARAFMMEGIQRARQRSEPLAPGTSSTAKPEPLKTSRGPGKPRPTGGTSARGFGWSRRPS